MKSLAIWASRRGAVFQKLARSRLLRGFSGISLDPVLSLRGPAAILPYRALLAAMALQNSFVLVFMGYRTIIVRYGADWGIAQMCLCGTKCHGGGCHTIHGRVLTSLKTESRDVGPLRSWG